MGTSAGDRQASRRVVQYLLRLPFVDRIKAVKDVVLTQLDRVQVQLAALRATTDALKTTTDALKTTSDELLANDSALLQAMIGFAQVLEQPREESSLLSSEVSEPKRPLSECSRPGQSHTVRPMRPDMTPRGDVVRTPGASCFPEPEAALMMHLYSYLPNRCALDIGANTGDVSELLLDAGFEVHAFEPYSQVFDHLRERLGSRKGFHPHALALGDTDGTSTLHVASDTSGTGAYGNSTRYSSLVQHSMPADLAFTDKVQVAVRRLETLHREASIPAQVGLVKIDTEGFDLNVVRGMGPHRYPVIVSEYWDSQIPFGGTEGVHTLAELVEEMRPRGYHWHIVFYRIWGRDGTRFYCNLPRSLEGAWGNVFFFQEYDLFSRARDWASTVFPLTYLTR